MPSPYTKKESPKCGALTKKATPCQNRAGMRTDHEGEGACYKHGGNGGAPEGNKNAVTTGEYETIYVSALGPEEAALYEAVPARPLEQVTMDLKLICVRIHRMLIRQRAAMEKMDDDGMLLVSKTTEGGFNKTRIQTESKEYAPAIQTWMAIEDAMSRVQAVKARYISELRGVLNENPPDSGGLDAIVSVIESSAAQIAESRERAAKEGEG